LLGRASPPYQYSQKQESEDHWGEKVRNRALHQILRDGKIAGSHKMMDRHVNQDKMLDPKNPQCLG
jgi:hypothetical protein